MNIISYITQVSSTNNHSLMDVHSPCFVNCTILKHSRHFMTPRQHWPSLFLTILLFLDMICPGFHTLYVSLWQSFPFIIYILSQTNTKSFEHGLIMSASVLKAVHYWSVWLNGSQWEERSLTSVFWGLAQYFGWPALFWVNIINQRHLAWAPG